MVRVLIQERVVVLLLLARRRSISENCAGFSLGIANLTFFIFLLTLHTFKQLLFTHLLLSMTLLRFKGLVGQLRVLG